MSISPLLRIWPNYQGPAPELAGRADDAGQGDRSPSDPQSTNPVGSHPLAVYLPPGYNPRRRVPYPTLYLSHGSGGNEVDWSTQGAAGSILDNLIVAREIQPMVVVMTNFKKTGDRGAIKSNDNCGAPTRLVKNRAHVNAIALFEYIKDLGKQRRLY